MVDNILINDHDQLIATGHPKALEYFQHELYPKLYRAPSEVVLFHEPKSSR